MLKFLLVLVALTVAGCATSSGVREFQTYAKIFDEVVEASDTVLNEMAAQERKQRIRALDGKSISDRLERADISVFAPSADPPFVASLRFAVQSVATMNGVLLAYAEGQALEVMKEDVKQLQAAGIGFETLQTSDLVSPLLVTRISQLEEGLDVLIGIGSREAFRKELASSSDKINNLLDVVLSHSTIAFRTLTSSEFREYQTVQFTNAARAAELRQKIATKREMLAEWLHLIELSQQALNKAIAASAEKSGLEYRLVNTAVLLGDMKARADRIKRLAAQN
nr:hypothetical protein [uncultured Cohaesibacter sp.]